MSQSFGELRRYTVDGVDLKAVAATTIFTSDPQLFIVTDIIVRTTASTAITVAATATVGTNAATYNNIIGSTVLTNLTANNLVTSIMGRPPSALPIVVTAGSVVKFNVTNAATGTSQTASIDVIGYYLD